MTGATFSYLAKPGAGLNLLSLHLSLVHPATGEINLFAHVIWQRQPGDKRVEGELVEAEVSDALLELSKAALEKTDFECDF